MTQSCLTQAVELPWPPKQSSPLHPAGNGPWLLSNAHGHAGHSQNLFRDFNRWDRQITTAPNAPGLWVVPVTTRRATNSTWFQPPFDCYRAIRSGKQKCLIGFLSLLTMEKHVAWENLGK